MRLLSSCKDLQGLCVGVCERDCVWGSEEEEEMPGCGCSPLVVRTCGERGVMKGGHRCPGGGWGGPEGGLGARRDEGGTRRGISGP